MTRGRWVPGAWSWVAIAALLTVALGIGSRGDPGPPTEAQRVDQVASQVRCPTCRGLSAADSDAPAAEAMRDEVRRRVREGQTNGQIFAYLESRYGPEIRMAPPARGVGGLVWLLPVVAGAAAVSGLAVVFLKRRSRPGFRASDEDRALVEEALRR